MVDEVGTEPIWYSFLLWKWRMAIGCGYYL